MTWIDKATSIQGPPLIERTNRSVKHWNQRVENWQIRHRAKVAAMAEQADRDRAIYIGLVAAFVGQIAGRLVDLQWHVTHDEFEGGAQQLQAHWLIWLWTLFILAVAALGLRDVREPGQRRGYLIVLLVNLAYAAIAVIHFFQHLNHLEVDWAHLLLAITKVAGAAGVLWVIIARAAWRRRQIGAAT